MSARTHDRLYAQALVAMNLNAVRRFPDLVDELSRFDYLPLRTFAVEGLASDIPGGMKCLS